MHNSHDRLTHIVEKVREYFVEKHAIREKALPLTREVIRHSANAIRAVHRNEINQAQLLLDTARNLVLEVKNILEDHPDLYFSGYNQDAQKEYVEASAVYSFIAKTNLPTYEELAVEVAPYLNGLTEAASELRRYILDSLRRDDDSRSEELMEKMDEIYNIMVTMDFPDALTNGLRRTTDQLRGVLERTRGDITMTLGQRRLEHLLSRWNSSN